MEETTANYEEIKQVLGTTLAIPVLRTQREHRLLDPGLTISVTGGISLETLLNDKESLPFIAKRLDNTKDEVTSFLQKKMGWITPSAPIEYHTSKDGELIPGLPGEPPRTPRSELKGVFESYNKKTSIPLIGRLFKKSLLPETLRQFDYTLETIEAQTKEFETPTALKAGIKGVTEKFAGFRREAKTFREQYHLRQELAYASEVIAHVRKHGSILTNEAESIKARYFQTDITSQSATFITPSNDTVPLAWDPNTEADLAPSTYFASTASSLEPMDVQSGFVIGEDVVPKETVQPSSDFGELRLDFENETPQIPEPTFDMDSLKLPDLHSQTNSSEPRLEGNPFDLNQPIHVMPESQVFDKVSFDEIDASHNIDTSQKDVSQAKSFLTSFKEYFSTPVRKIGAGATAALAGLLIGYTLVGPNIVEDTSRRFQTPKNGEIHAVNPISRNEAAAALVSPSNLIITAVKKDETQKISPVQESKQASVQTVEHTTPPTTLVSKHNYSSEQKNVTKPKVKSPSVKKAYHPVYSSDSIGMRTHVVSPGDNLSKIVRYHLSAKYGHRPSEALVSQMVIGAAKTNKIKNPDLIYPNQKIRMPFAVEADIKNEHTTNDTSIDSLVDDVTPETANDYDATLPLALAFGGVLGTVSESLKGKRRSKKEGEIYSLYAANQRKNDKPLNEGLGYKLQEFYDTAFEGNGKAIMTAKEAAEKLNISESTAYRYARRIRELKHNESLRFSNKYFAA